LRTDALRGIGHTFGTLKLYTLGSDIFVWSLTGAVAAFLLVGLNFARRWHSGDMRVVAIASLGCVAWLMIIGIFSNTIHSCVDLRVITHAVAALGLLYMCVLDLLPTASKN
jgi:hypothetical protein